MCSNLLRPASRESVITSRGIVANNLTNSQLLKMQSREEDGKGKESILTVKVWYVHRITISLFSLS